MKDSKHSGIITVNINICIYLYVLTNSGSIPDHIISVCRVFTEMHTAKMHFFRNTRYLLVLMLD